MKHHETHTPANLKSGKKHRLSPLGHFLKFIGWWFGFTGLYGAFTVCPFGFGSAGVLGVFFALLVQDWRRLISFLKGKFSRRKAENDAVEIEPESEDKDTASQSHLH